MPLISFASPNPAGSAIEAVIVSTLGANRPYSVAYNQDLGVLFFVELPDATQTEADAVQAALIAAFPALTAGLQLEPHALLFILDSSILWTAMPAALTEILSVPANALRAGCSMRKVEQVRLVVNVLTAGAAGSILGAQWSTGGAFAFFDAGASGPQVAIASTGFKVSAWTNVPSGARADGVAIRIIGQGGNAVAAPRFGQILVEGR